MGPLLLPPMSEKKRRKEQRGKGQKQDLWERRLFPCCLLLIFILGAGGLWFGPLPIQTKEITCLVEVMGELFRYFPLLIPLPFLSSFLFNELILSSFRFGKQSHKMDLMRQV